MSRRAAAVALVALGALLGACDSDRRAISRDDLPDVPAEATESVELTDDGFSIDRVEVSTEDLVEFHNTGDEDHGIRTADHRIDTGLLLAGESTFVVFDQPGRYELFDVADEDETMVVVARAPAPKP